LRDERRHHLPRTVTPGSLSETRFLQETGYLSIVQIGLSQPPRFAPGPGRQAVRFLVAEELLPGRVPLQRAAEPVADVAQVADRGRAMTDLRGADRLLAALDALQPVLAVVSG